MLDPSNADRARLIKDQRGAAKHFVSLAQVRKALQLINVHKISFVERYVCEELGTPQVSAIGIGRIPSTNLPQY